MKYDIAAKVVIDAGKDVILREFLKLDLESSQYIENLPEETVSLRRSDFPLRVTLKDGRDIIVLIEIQTVFNKDFAIRLIEYTARFMLKYHLEVIPFVLLLTPSSLATGFYEDNRFTFKYEIVRFWEKQARDFLDNIYLYPFLPLMADGEKVLKEAENRIYEDISLDNETKGDFLTAMAIFAGLKDKELGSWLIERRRDIMIESPIYKLIEEDAFKKGIERGLEQGLEQGLEKGLKEGLERGKKEGIYEVLSLVLEIKFGVDGIILMEKIRKIDSMERLETIKEVVKIADKIQDIEKLT
jgi:hypothetical protein